MDPITWLTAKRKALASPRTHWDSWWQELGDFVSPRKAEITDRQVYPNEGRQEGLFDSTAVQANMTLAQGQLSLVTPMEEQWFQFDAPHRLKNIPEVRRWYAECTEITKLEIANSNFYAEVMESYLDRGAFGTCLLSLQESWDERSCLNFRAYNIGTYSIEESAQGYIDTVFPSRKMSARQIVTEWPDAELPPKLAQAANDPKKMHEVCHHVHMAVFPRGEAPWESVNVSPYWWDKKVSYYVWVEEPDAAMLHQGGFDSNPFVCSRYLKWGDDPYGWCPGWAALPESRQLNYLEMTLDNLAELQAFPRLLIPSGMVDRVDLAPGGVTVFNQFQQQSKPEEWASAGRYDVGLDRAQRKERKINEAYHVDLFKMFANMESGGRLTAREVAERSAEKIIQFSPTFARLTTEMLTPTLRRAFHVLQGRGKFPAPPMAAMEQDIQGVYVPLPEVIYVSKLALAIKTMQNTSFMSLMEAITPMIAVDPSMMRFINAERAIQGLSKNFGAPQEWLATQEEIEETEAAMAQQAQMAEAQAAAGTVGSIPPEMVDKLAGVMQG